jgi:hypothetical protein
MNKDLTTIKEWLVQNMLTLNTDKTKFITFHLRNADLSNIFNEITFDISNIKRFDNVDYL